MVLRVIVKYDKASFIGTHLGQSVQFLAHPVYVCGRCDSNSSTTEHESEVLLVVPGTTHLSTDAPTYLSTVTCSGHTSNDTCLASATAAAAAADGAGRGNGDHDNDDDDGESTATPPTVRRTTSSPPCARTSLNV